MPAKTNDAPNAPRRVAHQARVLAALALSWAALACGERAPDEDAPVTGRVNDLGTSPAPTAPAPAPTSTVPAGAGGGMNPAPSGTADPDGLEWYSTCGDPVCGPMPTDPGVPACAAGVSEGGACTVVDERCDANLGCGAALVCAASDPKLAPGGCPISRARYKTDIEYLTPAERAILAEQLLATPLATYRYRGGSSDAWQLGFIIEDVGPSPSVDASRDRVNLYGYTSMVVAALQQQQERIERLEAEVTKLRAACRE